MSALDDLPTPELGSPVQAEPRRWRGRRGSEEPIGTIDQRVTVLEGDRKAARGIAKAALVAALGSLGGVLIWALNAREAAGYQRARAEELRETVVRLRVEIEQLRNYIYRAQFRRDRDDAPSIVPEPPARKDIDP